MMPLIGESLDFRFYVFKQQFKASLEQFYIFNYAAEGQHEQIITCLKHAILIRIGRNVNTLRSQA